MAPTAPIVTAPATPIATATASSRRALPQVVTGTPTRRRASCSTRADRRMRGTTHREDTIARRKQAAASQTRARGCAQPVVRPSSSAVLATDLGRSPVASATASSSSWEASAPASTRTSADGIVATLRRAAVDRRRYLHRRPAGVPLIAPPPEPDSRRRRPWSPGTAGCRRRRSAPASGREPFRTQHGDRGGSR